MPLKRATKKKQKNNSNRRNMWLIVLAVVLIIVSIGLFTPLNERINMGLDIQGGLSVVLTATSEDGESITDDDMESSRAIIENRVNALGATEATVQIQGSNQILVQIPGLSDTEEALATIGKTGQLVFARLDTFTDEDVVSSIENGTYASQDYYYDDFGNAFPSGEYTYTTVEEGTYTPLITGENLTRVTVDRASDTSTDYAVDLTLDSAGASAFAEATADLAPDHGQIVIILDNEIQSAPAVQSEIPNGEVSITGNYTLEEAQSLKTVLESGSLPVSFEYSQSQVVGPTLGQEALWAGILVALIGLVLVMIYLLIFYKGLGIITAAAMIVFALLYLGVLAGFSLFGQFSLSLAGIAGIVLTIGMAADSSILTLERFREEIRMGRSVRAASITGVRHAILTSIDADLVTLVSALALFFIATASVKGFGLTLAIGIVCDIVMMLVFKAPIIRLLAPRTIAKHPGFWGIQDSLDAANYYRELAGIEGVDTETAEEGAQINEQETETILETEESGDIDPDAIGDLSEAASSSVTVRAAKKIKGRFIKRDINFVGHRRIFLTIAACCMVACFAIVGVRFAIGGVDQFFGIEFVGGTSITFNGTGDITTEEMRTAFDDAGEPDAVIQTTTSNGEPGFLVRTTTTDAEDAATTANTVVTDLGLGTESYEVETIGPDWGTSVIQSSVLAFLVSIILIIIYIAIRFEYKMGLVAIVALLHDLILVVGIYALFGREVTPNTIAALLTILGYSLYDTVVVFHRINDNMKGESIRCTFATMANHSINQVFLRTINTTLTSFIPVLAMFIFGGETLKDFAFAMAIGLIAGSYSSIAVATPLYTIWKTHEPRYKKLQNKYGKKIGIFEFYQMHAEDLVQVPLARQTESERAGKVAVTSSGVGGTISSSAPSAPTSSAGSSSKSSSAYTSATASDAPPKVASSKTPTQPNQPSKKKQGTRKKRSQR